MRLQLVVNPAAGGGRAARALPRARAALLADGHDLLTTPTRSLEHAAGLAASAVADDRVVVAMGGDGLVGRVAGATSAAGGLLALVPGGRGNDLVRALGLPQDAVRACRALATATERLVDLGRVRSADGAVDFVGVASVGFDSAVQERVLGVRLPLGRLVYLYAALGAVRSWQPAAFTGSCDGAPFSHRGWSVAAAGSGVYGGGMRIAPDASLEDGLLDLVTTAATSRTRFLRSLPRVFTGSHVGHPSVAVRRVAELQLAADRPFRVFADGEPVGVLPCTISVRPAALRVLT